MEPGFARELYLHTDLHTTYRQTEITTLYIEIRRKDNIRKGKYKQTNRQTEINTLYIYRLNEEPEIVQILQIEFKKIRKFLFIKFKFIKRRAR